MDDHEIVKLYWARSEQAITETDRKYHGYCYGIARNILFNNQDAEEAVNDTYFDAWNSMPPNRPSILATFLGKITRRISIDFLRRRCADKRGGGELPLALDELEECVAGSQDIEVKLLHMEFVAALHRFLDELPPMERRVFLRRYWYFDSIKRISMKYPSCDSHGTEPMRYGYDIATALGSNLNFTKQTASISNDSRIEILNQNFGFDPDHDITVVQLDLTEKRYWLDIAGTD